MIIDDYVWRPITFQGVTFPPTLMAIDVLGAILQSDDEDLSNWLWSLPICRGVSKTSPAERCARCAQTARDLMVQKRQRILRGIKKRLGPYGFDVHETYNEWISALSAIVELSTASQGDCEWSAPSHLRDRYKSPADLLRNFDKAVESQSTEGSA